MLLPYPKGAIKPCVCHHIIVCIMCNDLCIRMNRTLSYYDLNGNWCELLLPCWHNQKVRFNMWLTTEILPIRIHTCVCIYKHITIS